jgi:hypothetical protein
MSEENTNDVIPAVLAEGEAVISAEKAEEWKAVIEEVLDSKAKAEEIAQELEAESTITVVEEAKEENVISSGSQKSAKPSDFAAGLTAVAGGVIGTGTVKQKPSVKKENTDKRADKVAVHSTKNVSWSGVGKVYRGYNIVTKEQADKWLTRDHIRLATPEEVAQEFGR